MAKDDRVSGDLSEGRGDEGDEEVALAAMVCVVLASLLCVALGEGSRAELAPCLFPSLPSEGMGDRDVAHYAVFASGWLEAEQDVGVPV